MSEKGLGEGASPVVGLVDYQDGAVVSRTLVKKDKGTVTVFAFDRDQALSEHTVIEALPQRAALLAELILSL